MIIRQDELERILKTGWQSWSWDSPAKTTFKFPICCYPPQAVSPPLKIEISNSLKKPVKGWCSYYAYGHNISENKILNQMQFLQQNNLSDFEYILIDGGWTKWGDWLETDKNKFPNGIQSLSKQITKAGFKPGIWLAPFLVTPNSNLAQKHPDWLIKDKKGNFIEGLRLIPGNNLIKFRRSVLDLNNPDVKKYLDKVFKFLLETCNFSLIKLDWLYSIYYDPQFSMKQANNLLRSFLLGIKKNYPKVYTIACGCPLIPALGAVDSMRIGADILIPHAQNIPLLNTFTNNYLYKKALHNSKTRGWTNKYWNVDLDAFCCRESLGLSDAEIIRLQNAIIETEGNIFLGDDITKLPKKRIRKFILPLLNR